MANKLILKTDREEELFYKEVIVVEYIPKNIRICKMVHKDQNGNHPPFVVIDYYDKNDCPVCSMPYFGEHFVNPILRYIQEEKKLPGIYYKPCLLLYVTVNLIRPAYCLINHTHVLCGYAEIKDIYKPATNSKGEYMTKDKVTFLVKCVTDNEIGIIQKSENIERAFNSYFNYCFEYDLGKKREKYLEMINNY